MPHPYAPEQESVPVPFVHKLLKSWGYLVLMRFTPIGWAFFVFRVGYACYQAVQNWRKGRRHG